MKYIPILFMFLIAPVFGQVADTATLHWIDSILREDGSPLAASEISGYVIHSVNHEGVIAEASIDSPTTSYSFTILPGSYTFAIQTIDIYGLTSKLSEPLFAIVHPKGEEVALPMPPPWRDIPAPPGGFSGFECSSEISCTFDVGQ